MEKIRRSAPYQETFKNMKVVVEGRVREEHLPAHLMFAASFNATGGAWSTLHPALAQLSIDAVTRASLARELDGFHRSMQDLSDLRGTHPRPRSPASPSEGSTRPEPAITGLALRGEHPP